MIGDYLTKYLGESGCFLYIYSAVWSMKNRSVHQYYTGITNDVDRRWAEHCSGTKSGWKGKMNWRYHHKPSLRLEFIGFIKKGVRFDEAEKYVKSFTKEKKLELIKSEYNNIILKGRMRLDGRI